MNMSGTNGGEEGGSSNRTSGTLSTTVKEAWGDPAVLDALLAEGGTAVENSKPKSYILRKTTRHLVVRTMLRGIPVLWIREDDVYAAAVKKDGAWSPVVEGKTRNDLLNKHVLPSVQGSAKAQLSANTFFLVGKSLPRLLSVSGRRCFTCATDDPRPTWRFGSGLQNYCTPCWQKRRYRQKKRQLEERSSDAESSYTSASGEESDPELWTSTSEHFYCSILLTGTTFFSVSQLTRSCSRIIKRQ